MKHPLLIFSLAAALLPPASADGVVATIKPLHSIVQAVMGDTEEAALIVSGAASVHGVALTPSQARALYDAEVVFYIHEDLESFLPEEVLGRSGAHAAADFRDVYLLPVRGMGEEGHHDDHDEHGHDEHDEHGHEEHDDHDGHGHDDHEEHAEHGREVHDHHDHGPGVHDLHIWLDIDNAKAIARVVVEVLSARSPENAAAYVANNAALQRRLNALDGELAEQLLPLSDVPYIVFHDAYQYVEDRYGLRPPLPLLANPHLPASARQLREVKRRLAREGIQCAFSEPQFSAKPLEAVAGEVARVGQLDPLGADLQPGAGLYPALMRNLAREMAGCLGGD